MLKTTMFLSTSGFLSLLALGAASTTVNDYKDQYCTDPRTMRKHNAYTEWADVYSCTRHRCQPGGRNLAIYTVGCKRVEAPESAIECEEVVEDTNMQFPYCCTRLRCLVVVRGEVWTRVLGQPWEILPAAPWSHMYKMKKPPPGDEPFGGKKVESGPVYELVEPEGHRAGEGGGVGERVMRSGQDTPRAASPTEVPDFSDAVRKINPAPDIVIALATSNDLKPKKSEKHPKRPHKQPLYADEEHELDHDPDLEEPPATEKSTDAASQEYNFGPKQPLVKAHQVEWNDHTGKWPHSMENDIVLRASNLHSDGSTTSVEDRHEEVKGTNLQALVDAIGTRMKDIENVVQKMSDKVHQGKKEKADLEEIAKGFLSKAHGGSKYLHDSTTEPVYLEDNNLNGYFSDGSNNIRRAGPKEPAQTVYMAPVEAARRKTVTPLPEGSDEDKRHKKHHSKKKHTKAGHSHKKHRKGDKRKRFNRLNSVEADQNVVSVEDSASVNA